MKLRLLSILLLPLALCAAFPAAAQTPQLTREDLSTWLDGFVPLALQRGDLAGAAIVVVKDSQVLLQKGYGYADVESKRPMDPERTLVRPGSIAKLFTWTAVMQLLEQGKLDLDRDINDYLDFKIENPFGRRITLRDLMTHRAGFEDGLKSIMVVEPQLLMATEEYLKTHVRPVIFPPGEVPGYSNYGASLAGYIVQRVSGEPYESYIERHIFAPLDMDHSTFGQPPPAVFAAAMSQGYVAASDPPRPFELFTVVPAGGLSATAADMAKFMIAHLQEGGYGSARVLEPKTARLMHAAAAPRIADFRTSAHGFFEEDQNGRRIIGHGGDTVLFHSALHLLLDEGVGIFLVFNSRGAGGSSLDTRTALFDAFLDRYFTAPAESPTAATGFVPVHQHAQRIAGRYWSSRRVASAFIGALDLLGQDVITTNADGTINVASAPNDAVKPYREIAPFIWSEVDGDHKVALVQTPHYKIVVKSERVTSVLQAVPGWQSAGWNVWLLCASSAVLLMVVIRWPFAALARRLRDRSAAASSAETRAYTLTRLAALVDLVYLVGWIAILTPVATNTLEVYNETLDPYIRALQFAGLLALAAAVVGVWNAWRALRGSDGWQHKLWRLVLAIALLDVAWIGIAFKLLSFNLNY